ncbi:MAG: hypothetical protein M3464_11785 [Chloroflexota bacterium]|nr:hypothetical protein [Chloroflexota bacterium]
MTTTTLLDTLTAAGVKLQLKDGQLRFRSTTGQTVPPDLREQIIAHRGDRLAALTTREDGWPPDDEWPGNTGGASTPVPHTGFASLDDVIIESEASRHSLEQIEAVLAHARALAAEQPESPLHQQVVRDWLAIERAKQRQLGDNQRKTA